MRTRDINKELLVKQKAIETIVKYGLEGFTINKLAKACGISVGTPYVYYKDKDDLIVKIVMEEGARMEEAMLLDFDPEASLEDGLRIQWRNRFNYMIENPMLGQFFDQINSSTYQDQFLKMFNGEEGNLMSLFKKDITTFIHNVVKRGEMDEMPFEVYWSVAYSPLYSLLRFHHRGKSIGGKPFQITDEILWAAFDRVVKALKN
ncbi:TetR/AcrR family transcriptional regulator [Pedobacter jeongneungensis]|uniref:TetR/AcrR family transcriptional regulator n=1 Tax=Pedobacter jeongneungensis TaxID=947309 RepID=UPI000468EE34|nr:TetR/AcrR family transcriptional regulator [Pedobacter jeongneungensis]